MPWSITGTTEALESPTAPAQEQQPPGSSGDGIPFSWPLLGLRSLLMFVGRGLFGCLVLGEVSVVFWGLQEERGDQLPFDCIQGPGVTDPKPSSQLSGLDI